MTSKNKADLAARAAQMQRRPARTTPGEPASSEPDTAGSEPRRAAPRAKPVRITTDLDPQTYRALTTYCVETAEYMLLTKVPHAEVIRVLLGELQKDEGLRQRVSNEIAIRRRMK